MAKRLTDTAKWDKIWFRKLDLIYKCLWVYICDRCDYAGIWDVDFETASHYIGQPLKPEEAKEVFSKQYTEINGGLRWLIKDFVVFQYGQVDETNKMYKPIKTSLERYGVSMGDIWGINGGKVQRTVKVKVKEKVNKGGMGGFKEPTVEEVREYCKLRKNDIDPEYFFDKNSTIGWVDKNGNKYKDWKAIIRTWERWTKKERGSEQPKILPCD